MFHLLFFIFSLALLYASSSYYFELRIKKQPVSTVVKLQLCVGHLLPFAGLSAFVIKSMNVENDLKVVLIAIGSLICLFVILKAGENILLKNITSEEEKIETKLGN